MPDNLQVSLFPIPDVVAFPGTMVPLHVFEPRYRQMIQDSVAENRMIAVCHTRKEIHSARGDQSIQDALSSNQATYEPVDVFSAGSCDIVKTTADGRIYVNISVCTRLQLVEEIQTLPYRIVTCSELKDVNENEDAAVSLQRSITNLLLALIERQYPSQLQSFDANHWLELSPADFSFQVFQLLRFNADTMQTILESTSALTRLNIIDTMLNQRRKK